MLHFFEKKIGGLFPFAGSAFCPKRHLTKKVSRRQNCETQLAIGSAPQYTMDLHNGF